MQELTKAEKEELVSQLTKKGLNQKAAISLVVSFPERCKQQLEWLPHRTNVQNPGQFLFMAITHNYDPPIMGGGVEVVQVDKPRKDFSELVRQYNDVLADLYNQVIHLERMDMRSAELVKNQAFTVYSLAGKLQALANQL